MKSRVFGCLGTLLVLTFVVSIGVNLFFLMFHFGGEKHRGVEPLEEEMLIESKGAGDHKIAQIDITGLISTEASGAGGGMVESTKRQLRQAVDDPSVKAIVVRVDSPGGEVTASDTLYHAIKLAREKKPVIIYMDSVAASGGYYLSCGGSKIIANENTWTGSIGVVVQGVGYGQALEKLGLEMRVFRSGNFKDTFYGQRAITPEEEAYVQAMVMQTYDRFVGIVSDARKIPVDKLKAEIADGRVFSGADAVKLGLVDQTGFIETAYDAAKKAAGIKEAAIVRYEKNATLLELVGLSAKAAATSPKISLDLTGGILPKLQAGRCYLLPASFVQ